MPTSTTTDHSPRLRLVGRHARPAKTVDPCAARIAELMASMAAGHQDSIFDFRDECIGALERTIRWVINDLGLAATPDEIESLVTEFALVIADRAGSWRANGGAQPWTWSKRAAVALVQRELKRSTSDHDRPDTAEPARFAAVADENPVDVVDRMAHHHPRFRHLANGFEWARVSPRDRRVWLEYELQQAQGDPSPSATVAAMLDMTEANVRQIVSRTRSKLRRVGVLAAA